MNDLPREKLCELIANPKYGRTLCDNPQRCEGLLRDFCGQYRAEIFVLVTALKEGIAGELIKSSQISVPKEIILARLSKRLQDLGMAKKSACWTVNSWALALGVNCQLEESEEEAEFQQKELLENEEKASHWKQLAAKEQEKSQKLEEDLETQIIQRKEIEQKVEKFRTGLKLTTVISVLIATVFGVFAHSKNQEIEYSEMQISKVNRNNNELEQENNELKQENSELEGKLDRIERAIKKQVDRKFKKVGTGSYFYLKNQCSKPIKIAIRYKQSSGDWRTGGWWDIRSYKNTYLTSGGERIRFSSPLFYYYAESQEGGSYWSGEESIYFSGRTLPMRIGILFPDSDGDYTLSLTCSN